VTDESFQSQVIGVCETHSVLLVLLATLSEAKDEFAEKCVNQGRDGCGCGTALPIEIP
jgi:hypothetical protein